MVNFGDFKYLNDGQVWVCLKCRGQNLTRYVLWVNVRWVVNPQNVCVCVKAAAGPVQRSKLCPMSQ